MGWVWSQTETVSKLLGTEHWTQEGGREGEKVEEKKQIFKKALPIEINI